MEERKSDTSQPQSLENCSVCLQPLTRPIVTNCGHVFCEACVCRNISETSPLCPLCRTKLTTINSQGDAPPQGVISFVFNNVRYKLHIPAKKQSIRVMVGELLEIPPKRLKFVFKGRLVADDKELPDICNKGDGILFVVGSRPAEDTRTKKGFFAKIGQKMSDAAGVCSLFLSSLVSPSGGHPEGVARGAANQNARNGRGGSGQQPPRGGRNGFGPTGGMRYNYSGCGGGG